MTIFTETLKIHPSWENFLSKRENISELLSIQSQIGGNCTPKPHRALRFLECDLAGVKVIILGQDPYPQEGIATGRAFEVSGLMSWQDKIKQTSLRNILRAVYLAYNGKNISLSQIREEIKNDAFEILPPHLLFDSLEKQGVLLLNTTFTCECSKPSSHIKIWEDFSNRLFGYISENAGNALWFLWGGFARTYEKYAKGKSYVCNHPMLAGTSAELDFLKCKCFSETLALINWKGI